MAGLSKYLQNSLIDHVFRGTVYTAPSEVFVALFTEVPDDEGNGIEVSDPDYARQGLSTVLADGSFKGTSVGSPTEVSSGTNGTILNESEILFPQATQSNGFVRAFGVFDAVTGGNLLVWADLEASKRYNANDLPPSFDPIALSIQLDN